MIRRTAHKRTARRVLGAAAAVTVLAGTGIAAATVPAKADPGIGCERINWGLHILPPGTAVLG